jgi:hypothetical protein
MEPAKKQRMNPMMATPVLIPASGVADVLSAFLVSLDMRSPDEDKASEPHDERAIAKMGRCFSPE